MAQLSKQKKGYLKLETTYGSEAGSTDGSDMVWLPLASTPTYTHEAAVLEGPLQTGRLWRNDATTGSDGGTINLSLYILPLSGAAYQGQSPQTGDYLDLIHRAIFPSVSSSVGRHASSVAAGTMTVTASFVDEVVVFCDTLTTIGKAQIAFFHSGSSATVFNSTPTFEQLPTASSTTVFGTRTYYSTSISGTVGNSLTITLVDGGSVYTFKGCRPTSAKVNAPIGALATIDLTLKCDSRTEETSVKSALPTVGRSKLPKIKGLASPIFLDDTKQTSVKATVIDYGIQTVEVGAQEALNGRSEIQIIGYNPTISFQPLRAESFAAIRKTLAATRVACQIGSGLPTTVEGTTHVPTIVFHFNQAQLVDLSEQDDGGVERQGLTYNIVDAGYNVGFGATAILAKNFQVIRV